MSLDSIKRDLKDYIEENKASLEAWEKWSQKLLESSINSEKMTSLIGQDSV